MLDQAPLNLLPLLMLLLWRRWRVLGVFCAGAAGLTALSVAVLGNWLPGYLALLADFTRQGETLSNYPIAMHNWRGLISVLLGSSSSPLALGLLAGLDLLSVALLLWVGWPRARRQAPRRWTAPLTGTGWEVRFALAILLGLLVSPHLYLHDAVFALPAGFMLWRASRTARPAAANPAAGAGHPVTGQINRLYLLRWVLAVGAVVAFVVQFWGTGTPGIQVGPWYLVVVILTVLWAWQDDLVRLPGASVVGATC